MRAIKLFAATILFAAISRAQDLNNEEPSHIEQSGVVELEKQEDYSLSYKKRRSQHGALFSVSMEKFYPSDFRSLYNDAYIENIIGDEKIELAGLELGYKHNIGPLSISALGAYSQGSIKGLGSESGREIKINKLGASVNMALDAVFEEPWVVPYAQAGVHQFNLSESKATTADSRSATTGFAVNYKYGLLFQLDWLENAFDKSAKNDRLQSSGLENTYIDVYITEYLASSNADDPSQPPTEGGDPNLLSSGEIGLGLKLEF